MNIHFRNYNPDSNDYFLVERFLIEHHRPGNRDGNWLAAAWEYMHSHPMLDRSSLECIGLWEDDGLLVGVATYESVLGEAFFQFHPGYELLRQEMLEHAEARLSARAGPGGGQRLNAFINDWDTDMLELVRQRGYRLDLDETRSLAAFEIPEPFPTIRLPAGFVLKSLADECDWRKLDRVLWRGFNHPGEPPADGPQGRQAMADTPHYDLSLKIFTQAPNGDFTSFCGMWIDLTNRICYVEPVATDPAYRRMGLGGAAVLEGIRRCALLGAQTAYVISTQAFYQALGFTIRHTTQCWTKQWDEG